MSASEAYIEIRTKLQSNNLSFGVRIKFLRELLSVVTNPNFWQGKVGDGDFAVGAINAALSSCPNEETGVLCQELLYRLYGINGFLSSTAVASTLFAIRDAFIKAHAAKDFYACVTMHPILQDYIQYAEKHRAFTNPDVIPTLRELLEQMAIFAMSYKSETTEFAFFTTSILKLFQLIASKLKSAVIDLWPLFVGRSAVPYAIVSRYLNIEKQQIKNMNDLESNVAVFIVSVLKKYFVTLQAFFKMAPTILRGSEKPRPLSSFSCLATALGEALNITFDRLVDLFTRLAPQIRTRGSKSANLLIILSIPPVQLNELVFQLVATLDVLLAGVSLSKLKLNIAAAFGDFRSDVFPHALPYQFQRLGCCVLHSVYNELQECSLKANTLRVNMYLKRMCIDPLYPLLSLSAKTIVDIFNRRDKNLLRNIEAEVDFFTWFLTLVPCFGHAIQIMPHCDAYYPFLISDCSTNDQHESRDYNNIILECISILSLKQLAASRVSPGKSSDDESSFIYAFTRYSAQFAQRMTAGLTVMLGLRHYEPIDSPTPLYNFAAYCFANDTIAITKITPSITFLNTLYEEFLSDYLCHEMKTHISILSNIQSLYGTKYTPQSSDNSPASTLEKRAAANKSVIDLFKMIYAYPLSLMESLDLLDLTTISYFVYDQIHIVMKKWQAKERWSIVNEALTHAPGALSHLLECRCVQESLDVSFLTNSTALFTRMLAAPDHPTSGKARAFIGICALLANTSPTYAESRVQLIKAVITAGQTPGYIQPYVLRAIDKVFSITDEASFILASSVVFDDEGLLRQALQSERMLSEDSVLTDISELFQSCSISLKHRGREVFNSLRAVERMLLTIRKHVNGLSSRAAEDPPDSSNHREHILRIRRALLSVYQEYTLRIALEIACKVIPRINDLNEGISVQLLRTMALFVTEGCPERAFEVSLTLSEKVDATLMSFKRHQNEGRKYLHKNMLTLLHICLAAPSEGMISTIREHGLWMHKMVHADHQKYLYSVHDFETVHKTMTLEENANYEKLKRQEANCLHKLRDLEAVLELSEARFTPEK